MNMKERILARSEGLQSALVYLRREFHRFPELAWTEFRTASKVAEILEKCGYKVLIGEEIMCGDLMKNVPPQDILDEQMERAKSQGAQDIYLDKMKGGKTAVVGVLETGNPGPVVAIRVDMDALPITESDSNDHLPVKEGFRSENEGIMHACAHDGHTAVGLGLAMLFAQIKEEFSGTIKIIFQPAEEGVQGGATSIIKKGMVDDVDYMLGFHIGLASETGTLFCETTDFLASTKYNVEFIGQASHAGASPEHGKSALLAAAAAALSLQSIPRHSKGASRVSVGVLNSGTASNIVPDRAYMELESRGITTEINNFMKEGVYRTLEGAAKMYDVQIDLRPEIIETGDAIAAVCDPEIVRLTKEIAEELGIFERIEDIVGLGGSEDYTFFMEHVQNKGGKATHFIVGSDLAAKHHNEAFDFDESILWKIVALLGMMVYNFKN
jgi:aminobenzoyl-glutamate utilization protein A